MSQIGLQERITQRLLKLTEKHGYFEALVCTDEGLLVASAGDHNAGEELAGITSLFDDIVMRSERDLGFRRVDEVTLLDPGRGRLVFRPLQLNENQRFFLVVRLPTKSTWRRNTNYLCRDLLQLLLPLTEV